MTMTPRADDQLPAPPITILQQLAERYHDISCGHRVYGHESKCAHLHGHNYRVHFVCSAPALDLLGRVIDFSVMKHRLCEWLEREWDHRFLIWKDDPWSSLLTEMDPEGVVHLPFNPTAENMAYYLLDTIAPSLLRGTGVSVTHIKIWETRKCAATALRTKL